MVQQGRAAHGAAINPDSISLLQAAWLGLIEGLTEFLPISSTGHLIIASRALGLEGEFIDSFVNAIQSGAILAVLLLYPQRLKGLLIQKPGFYGKRALLCLSLSTLPALLTGALLEPWIKSHLYGVDPVAFALALGAVALWLLDKEKPHARSLDALLPSHALMIGLVQCLALWPGVSRSACTILAALALGYRREAAVLYSFFAAVPILLAVTGHELFKHHEALAPHAWALGLGWLVSLGSAALAIKLFVGMLNRYGLKPFAWYRLALGAGLWLGWHF